MYKEQLFDNFIKKYNGKAVDFDGRYGDQCVDLFRQYCKEVLGLEKQPVGVGGAKDFWTNFHRDPALYNNFKLIPNTPMFIPRKSDVMIWGRSYGPYGHIAVITEAGLMTFKAFSQNDPAGTKSHIKKYNYKNVLGVLRPRTHIKTILEIPFYTDIVKGENGIDLYGYHK